MYNRNYYHNKKRVNYSKIVGKIYLSVIILFLSFTLLYTIDSILINRGKIYPNVFAMNQKIGGLSKEEAFVFLQPFCAEMLNNPITINFDGWQSAIIPQEDMGALIELNELVDEAYEIARRGPFLFKIQERISLSRGSRQLIPHIQFQEKIFQAFFQKLQTRVERPIRNASLNENRIITSQTGIVIDRAQLIEDIEKVIIDSAFPDSTSNIPLPVQYLDPEYSTQQALYEIGISETLAKFETPLSGKEKNTLFNIEKAASAIDGIIIHPQEVFSFNKIVGAAEKDDGYLESTIIANGQFVKGYGGGVCQVSTTLYNAALLANLQIVERYNHSVYGQPTSYVPVGQDAAVFYGFKDLRFKNSINQLIVILSEIKPDKLIVTICGEKLLEKEIKIITQDLKTYDYEVVEIKREDLVNNDNISDNTLQEGIQGYEVKTYRITIDSNGEEMEFISQDRYTSVPGKILVD